MTWLVNPPRILGRKKERGDLDSVEATVTFYFSFHRDRQLGSLCTRVVFNKSLRPSAVRDNNRRGLASNESRALNDTRQ